MKKRLGLDLGVASVGWGLLELDDDENPRRIIDLGSFCFSELEKGKKGELDNAKRRKKRGARRQRRRKVYRLQKTRKLFVESKLTSSEDEFFEFIKNNKENVLELKLKGLNKELTKLELCKVLYNYMKYRGYISSRKADEKASSDKKLLNKIKDTSKKLEESDKTISQYLYDELEKLDYKDRRYHNHDTEYKLTVDNKEYKKEIELLLNNQINHNVIDENFRNDYLEIYNSRRSYAEGPDGRPGYSKYGTDRNDGITLIEKMRGKCTFEDGNSRAPKNSFSAKSFVFLSYLVNLRIKYDFENDYLNKKDNDGYRSLNKKGLNKIYNDLIFNQEIKYINVFETIGLEIDKLVVKGFYFTKKQDNDFKLKFIKDNENLKDVKFSEWDEKNKDKFKKEKNKKMFEKKFIFEDKIIPAICDSFKKHSSEILSLDELGNHIDFIVDLLFKFKSDKLIENELKKNGYNQNIINDILELESCTGTINLCNNCCKEIIPLLKEGNRYDEAVKLLGKDHSKRNKRNVTETGEKNDFIPPIDEALKANGINLKNPVVKNTLGKTIKIINAIIKKYGKIDSFSIEFSREIRKSFKERDEISKNQLDNMNNNNSLKFEILEKYPNIFSSFYSIKKNDLVKYKLFKEQNGISPYSGKLINEYELFNRGYYEVDHIIPYSRSFDDSFDNKVLVEREENQNKKNRTSFEYFEDTGKDINIIKNFIKNCDISGAKVDNLLKEKFEKSFSAQDLNSSAYIAKLAKQVISYFLLTDKNGNVIDDSNFLVINGTITDILKRNYGLKGKTHSFAAGDGYKNLKNEKLTSCKEVKNKEIIFTYDFFDASKKDKPIEEESFKYKIKKAPKNKELTYEEKMLNENIKIFIKFLSDFNKISEGKNLSNNELIKAISLSNVDRTAKEIYLFFIQNNITLCQNIINKKDRDNDLHHALDACVIASVNNKTIYKLANFYKEKENFDKNLNIPLPYDDFTKELILKVYERDLETLKNKILSLDNYKNIKEKSKIIDDIHVLYPVRLPKKIKSAAISDETIYGKKNYKNINNSIFTKKVLIHKLKEEEIKNIVNVNNGNGAVIKSIKEWFKLDKEERDECYPILTKHTKDGKDVSNYIKSVKVNINKEEKDLVKLGDKRFAENADFLITRIYKNKKDGKLYGMSLSWYHLFNEKNNKNINCYKLMYKQGKKGVLYVSKDELSNNFEFICEFNRNSLLEIKTKGIDNSFLCYAGALKNGQLEFYSILGDNYDLNNSIGLSVDVTRNLKTISTIEFIKVRNISLLGRIS